MDTYSNRNKEFRAGEGSGPRPEGEGEEGGKKKHAHKSGAKKLKKPAKRHIVKPKPPGGDELVPALGALYIDVCQLLDSIDGLFDIGVALGAAKRDEHGRIISREPRPAATTRRLLPSRPGFDRHRGEGGGRRGPERIAVPERLGLSRG